MSSSEHTQHMPAGYSGMFLLPLLFSGGVVGRKYPPLTSAQPGCLENVTPHSSWRQLLSKQPLSSSGGQREGQMQAYQPLPPPHAERCLLLLSTSPAPLKPSFPPGDLPPPIPCTKRCGVISERWWNYHPWRCSRKGYMQH